MRHGKKTINTEEEVVNHRSFVDCIAFRNSKDVGMTGVQNVLAREELYGQRTLRVINGSQTHALLTATFLEEKTLTTYHPRDMRSC